MSERDVIKRPEFEMYTEQNTKILDTLEKLLTQGIQGVQDRQDETNRHLDKLNGQCARHAEAIVSLGRQTRTLFKRVSDLGQSMGMAATDDAGKRYTTHILKKKETYIGGAAFVGLVEILKEFIPVIKAWIG